MAAAVAALDGSKAGEGSQEAPAAGAGVVSNAVFAGIADAIRTQNGLSETYTPGEMAAAILALEWDAGLKIRALLLSDGTLEFNYRDGVSSDASGAAVVESLEVEAQGYASAGERPWDDAKLDVKRVVFDGDFSQGGLASANYFFAGFGNLVEVEGFEALQGVGSFSQTFNGCSALETIYATEWAPSASPAGSLPFYSCGRLVGGQGFVPGSTTGVSSLCLGEDGVLTDPGPMRATGSAATSTTTGSWCSPPPLSPMPGARWRRRAPLRSGALRRRRLPALVRHKARAELREHRRRHGDFRLREHGLLVLRAFVGPVRGRARQPEGHARDALRLHELLRAGRARLLRVRRVGLGGRVLLLLGLFGSHDDMGRPRLGAARRVHGRVGVPSVHGACGRRGDRLRRVADLGDVHADRRGCGGAGVFDGGIGSVGLRTLSKVIDAYVQRRRSR